MSRNQSMRVEFSDRPFFLSHMKSPRGVGSWAFEFEDSVEPWFAPSLLSFAQAKAAAVAEARRRAGAGGVRTVVKVLP